MGKRIIAAVALASALLLTGCDDGTPTKSDIVQLGKECFDAGGSWSWSDWTGYHCEFVQEEVK